MNGIVGSGVAGVNGFRVVDGPIVHTKKLEMRVPEHGGHFEDGTLPGVFGCDEGILWMRFRLLNHARQPFAGFNHMVVDQ